MARTLASRTRNYRVEWRLFLMFFVLSVLYTARAVSYASFPKENPTFLKQKEVGRSSQADSSQRLENPVIPGDFADPSIIRQGKVYYATGTSSEWAPHFPLFKSTDMLHWQQIGYVLPKTPAWAKASFWAPELFYHNGTYYAYYVARKKSDGLSCIGVATSKDPAAGFTDRGILLAFGKEAIDPFVLEENGQLYITWKAYGLDQRPIEILGSRLSADGLHLEGEPFTLLRDEQKKGLEGQCLVKHGTYYYLFYSLGNCCGRDCSYQVEVARSATLRGPYTRFTNNPILAETDNWKCTGHGTVVRSEEGKDFLLYHAYSKTGDVYTGRQGMLGEVVWDNPTGWPTIQPMGKKVASSTSKNLRDEFSTALLSYAWQWDFRHSQPTWTITKGTLSLAGQAAVDNPSGTALTVRPLTDTYAIATEVVERNAALKGLVLYGDADQAVGIGVRNSAVEVWAVKNKKRTVLHETAVGAGQPVQVKMVVVKGYQCRFFWRESGKTWRELPTGSAYYNADFLPPWDRCPRPGLLHQGAATDPARFSFFEILYQ
ncbi:family 43 glycosylhydrolase [Hymenobacter volaticus]|uniref:Family 43 glycosylhydrolase n=1 Tax=Hymenobacter volaticus TaxID=2932254 RepID=A0ABY4GD04_9BACT|nr:family 43 glycosylhydrolase [Hymenobacter volaticus]UOQ68803.1 family 43 glycosylhydrolase [Hymenobacter volaticus]